MTSARMTCKDCGKYLGMYEGYYDKCEDCRIIIPLIKAIRDNLTDDLLKPKYRGNGGVAGHCYVASECFYYLYGKEHGWKPKCYRYKHNETHWWLEKDGEIVDITADQFDYVPFYRQGHYQMFMSFPSSRCKKLARRVKWKMKS